MRRGWLGLDVGTTSSKAVVYDDVGQQLGAARVPTAWTAAGPHVEIDPDVLLAGALAAANEAVAATDDDVEIAGIGLASMAETGVLIDRAGRPVVAAIAWHDPRDGAEVAALGNQIGRATFERRTGKPLRPQCSLTKLRWLLDHEPMANAGVRWFNVAEWVARGLGADECCELSLAARTGWFDLFRHTWDEELLAWSGATAALLPTAGRGRGGDRDGSSPALLTRACTAPSSRSPGMTIRAPPSAVAPRTRGTSSIPAGRPRRSSARSTRR